MCYVHSVAAKIKRNLRFHIGPLVAEGTLCFPRSNYSHYLAKVGQIQDSIPAGYVAPACRTYMLRWPPLDVSIGGVGGRGMGPSVNKFGQVSSDDHQML